MMNFDVFISYPHQDKATADAACAALEAEGIRCWIAPRDVAAGAEWASSLIEAIDTCRVMVLIFSASANNSKQIRREVQRAFEREVPVVPFRIENVVPEKSLAYYMGPVHWLDALTRPLEQHLRKLVVSVRSLAPPKQSSAAKPATHEPIPEAKVEEIGVAPARFEYQPLQSSEASKPDAPEIKTSPAPSNQSGRLLTGTFKNGWARYAVGAAILMNAMLAVFFLAIFNYQWYVNNLHLQNNYGFDDSFWANYAAFAGGYWQWYGIFILMGIFGLAVMRGVKQVKWPTICLLSIGAAGFSSGLISDSLNGPGGYAWLFVISVMLSCASGVLSCWYGWNVPLQKSQWKAITRPFGTAILFILLVFPYWSLVAFLSYFYSDVFSATGLILIACSAIYLFGGVICAFCGKMWSREPALTRGAPSVG
jgi:hypothetical protein